MKRFFTLAFTRLLFLLVVPSILLPHERLSFESGKIRKESSLFPSLIHHQPISYDDILELIDEIETGTIDECSEEELENVNHFLMLLAKQGLLPHQEVEEAPIVLAQDMQRLLNCPSFDHDELLYGHCFYSPWDFYHDSDVVLCKSFVKKSWDKTRKFVKRHKTEILIGAAIVAAVAVTVTAIVMSCGTATAGAALAADAIATFSQIENEEKKTSSSSPISSSEEKAFLETAVVMESPFLQETIEDQISSLRETISENIIYEETSLASFEGRELIEQLRTIGSYLAHETFDLVGTTFLDGVELLDDIRQISDATSEKLLPRSTFSQRDSPFFLSNPVEKFQEDLGRGHRFIDKVFKTELSQQYTPEGKEMEEMSKLPLQYAVLPPPGAFPKTASSSGGALLTTEGRLLMTECNSICGWKVGDPIQNRTWWGGRPKWSTVRQRYWKNQAQLAKSDVVHRYRDQINRMEKGLAPQIKNKSTGNLESIELHHIPAQKEGGLFDFIEVTREEHSRLDPFRFLGE